MLPVDPVSGVYIGELEDIVEEKAVETPMLPVDPVSGVYIGELDGENENDKQNKFEEEFITPISEKETFESGKVKLKQREELLQNRKDDKEMSEKGKEIPEEAAG